MRIGILDDNPVILDFLQATLTLDGHTVSSYTIGKTLLDALFSPSSAAHTDTLPFDLVILDLLLPGAHSGADVFLAIRKAFLAEELPILVITAVGDPTLEQFRRILPDDVPLLRKPFRPQVLRATIEKIMQQSFEEKKGIQR